MTGSLVWLEFAGALALVAWGGRRLSLYGEALGSRWGLGSTWVGLVLLATVTSLPELATSVSAVTLAKAPDIAVGAVLGSCVFNLLILVIVDFVLDRESIYTRLSRNHLLSAGYGVILLGVVGSNLVTEHEGGDLAIGGIGLYTPVLLCIYLLAVRSLHRYELENIDPDLGDSVEQNSDRHLTLVLRFGVAAVAVVGAGIWLPFVGERLAEHLGVAQTFTGTLFVAFATSMPEITVAVSAVRLGAPNMAVSNLLGSNLFNVAILVPGDLLYREGSLLASVDAAHTVSALSAMTMTGIAMVALLVRPTSLRTPRIGAVGMILIAIYLLNSYVIYLYG